MPTLSNVSGAPEHDTPAPPLPGVDGVTQYADLGSLLDFALAALNLPALASSAPADSHSAGPATESTAIAGQMQALTELWQRDTGLSVTGMDFHGQALDQLLAQAGLSSEAPAAGARDQSHSPGLHDLTLPPGSVVVPQIPVHPTHDWSN